VSRAATVVRLQGEADRRLLNISKFTVYNYLEKVREQKKSQRAEAVRSRPQTSLFDVLELPLRSDSANLTAKGLNEMGSRTCLTANC
jgi:hypothetical protein